MFPPRGEVAPPMRQQANDRFGRQCPVCGKRITPEFLRRHVATKHPTFDLKMLDA